MSAPPRLSAPESDAGSVPEPAARRIVGGLGVLLALAAAVVLVGFWHLTQGTSGLGLGDLLRGTDAGGVSAADVFTGSRLPRLLAGVAVGFALGVAGALLQSVTRNALASPDTLAVSAGAYFALCVVAAFGLAVPLWASGASRSRAGWWPRRSCWAWRAGRRAP